MFSIFDNLHDLFKRIKISFEDGTDESKCFFFDLILEGGFRRGTVNCGKWL
jgi:hypothetical protein